MIVFDFDGVFTDNRVFVLQDGSEGVWCSRADGLGLESAKKTGIQLLVLSKERNPVVHARCRKLDLPCIQGCDDKYAALIAEAGKLKMDLDHVAYLGNDINDIECMTAVGLPACVSDSHPAVIAVSRYVTKAKGGYGAVREFCDYIVDSRTASAVGK